MEGLGFRVYGRSGVSGLWKEKGSGFMEGLGFRVYGRSGAADLEVGLNIGVRLRRTGSTPLTMNPAPYTL